MRDADDVVYWLQERALRRYGATMNAAHTKTQEWLWADEITRLREELAAVTERMSKLDFERTAAELERDALREENARLREALKPFAARLEELEKMKASKYACATPVEIEHLRAARAAIREAGTTYPPE